MSTKVTVEDIVNQYLEEHGFDGLVSAAGECACAVGDIAPCGEMRGDCAAGYREKCDCGDHAFHIRAESERPERT